MDNIYILKYSTGDWEDRRSVNFRAYRGERTAQAHKEKLEKQVENVRAEFHKLHDSEEWANLNRILRSSREVVDSEQWQQAYDQIKWLEGEFWKTNKIMDLRIDDEYSLKDFNSLSIESVRFLG